MDDKQTLSQLISELRRANDASREASRINNKLTNELSSGIKTIQEQSKEQLKHSSNINKQLTETKDIAEETKKITQETRDFIETAKDAIVDIKKKITDKESSSNDESSDSIFSDNIKSLIGVITRVITSNSSLQKVNNELKIRIGSLIGATNSLTANIKNIGAIAPAEIQNIDQSQSNNTQTQSQPQQQPPANPIFNKMGLDLPLNIIQKDVSALQRYKQTTEAIGSIFDNLSKIKLTEVYKATLVMPFLVKRISNSLSTLKDLPVDKETRKSIGAVDTFAKALVSLASLDLKKIAINSIFLPTIVSRLMTAVNGVNELDQESLSKLKQISDSKLFEPLYNMFSEFQSLKLGKLISFGKNLPKILEGVASGANALAKIDENAFGVITKLDETLVPFLENASTSLSKISTSLIKISLAAGIFAGSLWILSKIESDGLLETSAAMLALSGAMVIMSKNLNYSNVLKAAGAIAILGASLLPLSISLNMLKDVNWKSLGIAAVALIGLAGAAAALSSIAPVIYAGSLAIAALGASLIPLSIALSMLDDINPSNLFELGKSLIGFSASIMPLLLSAPFFITLSAALIPFTASLFVLSRIGNKLKNVNVFFDKFSNLTKKLDGDKLWDLSKAIGALSVALGAFAAADFGSTIAGAFSGFIDFFSLGNSPIDKLKELSNIAGLKEIGPAIRELAHGLNMISQIRSGSFAAFNELPWDKLQNIATELERGATLQIVPIVSASSLRTQTLDETGSKMSGGGQIIVNNIVSNSGGNVTTTNMSNKTTNLKAGPQIVSPRAQEL